MRLNKKHLGILKGVLKNNVQIVPHPASGTYVTIKEIDPKEVDLDKRSVAATKKVVGIYSVGVKGPFKSMASARKAFQKPNRKSIGRVVLVTKSKQHGLVLHRGSFTRAARIPSSLFALANHIICGDSREFIKLKNLREELSNARTMGGVGAKQHTRIINILDDIWDIVKAISKGGKSASSRVNTTKNTLGEPVFHIRLKVNTVKKTLKGQGYRVDENGKKL